MRHGDAPDAPVTLLLSELRDLHPYMLTLRYKKQSYGCGLLFESSLILSKMLLHSDILVLNLLNDFLISLIFRFVIKIIISSKITNDKNTLTTKAVNIANISMYLLTFLSIRLHGVVGIAPAYAYAPI